MYITPSKVRSRKYESFHKKRVEKEKRKQYKEETLANGKEKDGYLEDAFNSSDEEEEQNKN